MIIIFSPSSLLQNTLMPSVSLNSTPEGVTGVRLTAVPPLQGLENDKTGCTKHCSHSNSRQTMFDNIMFPKRPFSYCLKDKT